MSGTLLKFVLVGVSLFAVPLFAQETKPVEKPVAPKVDPREAFVLAAVSKSAYLTAAVHLVEGTRDGEPTVQLYHSFGDGGSAVESWLVTQKVKDAESPIGRRLVHVMVYLDTELMDKDGMELETPVLKLRAMRLVNLDIKDVRD